jgi:redox-sensitive bicupin YhaK (pirin superfamily)
MSGPVAAPDVTTRGGGSHPGPPTVELTESRRARVGALPVRRALPRRARRTVGAWCFADHLGPAAVGEEGGVDIGPHPHIGLQTVTWLLEGEILHRDSLGSEQVVRPGQLNLMTAGGGVAHAEEATGRYRGPLHGVQLWVAQPEATRHGAPAFEHHAELPCIELPVGTATVLVGAFGGVVSPARRDSDHVGVDVDVGAPGASVELRADYEHALVVFSGAVAVDGHVVEPGRLAYLGTGRTTVTLDVAEPARALLVGGVPFDEPVLMWWNFVARDRDEIRAAYDDWSGGGDRFGRVASGLPRLETEPPR